MRKASINRNTKETSIKVDVNLDGLVKLALKQAWVFRSHDGANS